MAQVARTLICAVLAASFTLALCAFSPVDRWHRLRRIPTARNGLVGVVAQNQIMVIGGQVVRSGSGMPTNVVEDLAIGTNQWTAGVPLPTATEQPGAAVGTDGRVYVVGGVDIAHQVIGALQIWNPSSATWSTGIALPTSRAEPQLVTGDDGKLYAISGYDVDGQCPDVNEQYDPTT